MRTQTLSLVVVPLLAGGMAISEPIDPATGSQANETPTGVKLLAAEAAALNGLVESKVARQFLGAVASLPTVSPRTIYRQPNGGTWITEGQASALAEEQRQSLQPRTIDESGYYHTKYGTPLAYVRALDLVGQSGLASLQDKKVLDFGYGSVGQLRLMASCGANAFGLDVDSFLTALYSEPRDQGPVIINGERAGTVTLLNGRLSEQAIRDAAGEGFDLITSKNTLKRGYIHPPPEENVDKRLLVDLGLDDEQFLTTLFRMLKPGGVVMIYNLSPKPAAPGEKYIPWADGRCPFDRALIEKVGFRVLHFDVDDTEFAHRMAKSLKWDESMDVENDLFATYTLLRKPS